jgi:hypothetical protein
MIVFGFSSLPAPQAAAAALDAGERVEHALAAEILHGLEADLFLLEIEVRQVPELRRLQEHGDRRQDQMKVLRGRDQRHEGEDHQHVRPPVDPLRHRPLLQPEREEVGDHQRGDEQPDDDRLDRYLRAQSDRTHERPANQQKEDAAEDRHGKRRQRDAICREPGGVREIDDAEAAQEFGQRVAAERDEPPEHEGVRDAGNRPLADRSHLKDDVHQKAVDPKPEVVEGKRLGGDGNQLNATCDLRREGSDGRHEQQPERESGHCFSALIIAGTISNRSPTMP